MSQYGPPIGDDVYLDAVEQAIEDGAVDGADGGVHASTVAERLDVRDDAARKRLSKLVGEGDLDRVQGVDPETLRPRPSFVPADSG